MTPETGIRRMRIACQYRGWSESEWERGVTSVFTFNLTWTRWLGLIFCMFIIFSSVVQSNLSNWPILEFCSITKCMLQYYMMWIKPLLVWKSVAFLPIDVQCSLPWLAEIGQQASFLSAQLGFWPSSSSSLILHTIQWDDWLGWERERENQPLTIPMTRPHHTHIMAGLVWMSMWHFNPETSVLIISIINNILLWCSVLDLLFSLYWSFAGQSNGKLIWTKQTNTINCIKRI